MKQILKTLCLATLMAVPAMAWAGDEDDFGTWLELGASKALPHNLSVGVEGELRTDKNSSQIDRLSLGLNVGYKLNKYLKFKASYSFMESYSAEKRKEHYKDNDDGSLKLDADGNPIWNGYKITDSYWTPKHRLSLEVNGTVKLWKWLRLSLRERYQFTHKAQKEYNVEKYRFDKTLDGEGNASYELKDGYPITELDSKSCSSDNVLRSRLKIEVDKKRLAWSPFVSVETHNDLSNSMSLQKLRTSVGTEYKINSSHALSLAYVFTCDFSEDPNERMHAVSLGYSFDF